MLVKVLVDAINPSFLRSFFYQLVSTSTSLGHLTLRVRSLPTRIRLLLPLHLLLLLSRHALLGLSAWSLVGLRLEALGSLCLFPVLLKFLILLSAHLIDLFFSEL